MAETLKDKAEAAGHKIAGNRDPGSGTRSMAKRWRKRTAGRRRKPIGRENRVEEIGQKARHKAKETFGDTCDTSSIDLRH